jgi:hypothetical protein
VLLKLKTWNFAQGVFYYRQFWIVTPVAPITSNLYFANSCKILYTTRYRRSLAEDDSDRQDESSLSCKMQSQFHNHKSRIYGSGRHMYIHLCMYIMSCMYIYVCTLNKSTRYTEQVHREIMQLSWQLVGVGTLHCILHCSNLVDVEWMWIVDCGVDGLYKICMPDACYQYFK